VYDISFQKVILNLVRLPAEKNEPKFEVCLGKHTMALAVTKYTLGTMKCLWKVRAREEILHSARGRFGIMSVDSPCTLHECILH
jgi:hypothetical protein